MQQPAEILSIQKFVYLLDGFHYEQFTAHLRSINAGLPLKLVETIRNHIPAFDSPDALCKKIYGGYSEDQRKSFNQLSYHTIKMSYYLAWNYPGYLLPSVQRIQQAVNEGDYDKANQLAEFLLSISERVEDYQAQALALKFLSQQAFLMKDFTTGIKFDRKLTEVCECEMTLNKLISALRELIHLSLGGKKVDFRKNELLFKSFHKHASASVRIYSKYANLYLTYFFEPSEFSEPYTLALIKEVERELANNSFVIFPFLFDITGSFGFLKLNSSSADLADKEYRKELKELSEHYAQVKFWKSYLNLPKLFMIAIKATHYISKYHYYLSRKDYLIFVGKDSAEIKSLLAECEELLQNKHWDKHYRVDVMSIEMLYGSLLILMGGDSVKKGISQLEYLLTSYQQMNLAGSTDSIFLCLMAGYFAQKQYDKCAHTYIRYYKATAKNEVYEINDLNIHSYYYLSQFLVSNRVQYLGKIQSNLKQIAALTDGGTSAKYFNDLLDYLRLTEVAGKLHVEI